MYCEVFLILKKNVSQTGASPNQILTITLQQMISQWMSVRQEVGISSWSNLFLNEFSLYLSTGEDNEHQPACARKQRGSSLVLQNAALERV